jgi:unsaturated rhamnogalacturonyl hydrolase
VYPQWPYVKGRRTNTELHRGNTEINRVIEQEIRLDNMNSTRFLFLVLIISFLGYGFIDIPVEQKPEKKWSIRMANSVMLRSDSLIHHLGVTNPKWSYDVGFLGMAIDRLGKIDQKYSDYMEDWVNYFINEDGSVKDYKLQEYNLDRIYPANNILTLYQRNHNPVYKIALDNFVKQMETHPKTKSGGFWHKKIYPWQMWLDGIFMASPFLARYASEFNQPQWYDVVTFQVKEIYRRTLYPESGLLAHAWDETREQKWCDPATGKSHFPWSRSIGWYTMAIEDILDWLPQNHPDRDSLITILQKTCDALVKVSDPATGLYYQVLDQGKRPGNYLEGSGSAMFTYVFARGAHNGYLDKKYLDIANRNFDSIIREFIRVDKNGLVSMINICAVGGLGGNPYRDGSYEYYINEKKQENDPKGVAPFILAAIELNK